MRLRDWQAAWVWDTLQIRCMEGPVPQLGLLNLGGAHERADPENADCVRSSGMCMGLERCKAAHSHGLEHATDELELDQLS